MNFQQADQVFRQLTHQYHQKKISIAVYREKVNELRVKDSQGAVWKPQAFTGVWHVQKEGQWVAARPPGYTPVAQKARPKKSRGKIFAVFAGLGSLGVIAVCVLTIAAGVLLWFSPDIMDWMAQEAENWGFVVDLDTPADISSVSESMEIVSTLQIPADSNRYTDEHGVSLMVPSEALEDGSEQIVMNAYSPSRELSEELSEAFHFESLVYEVGVDGEMDGAGKAELELPFQGNEAVLMVIIDNEYYGFFDQIPENGVVKVHAHLGNMESGEITQAYYGDDEIEAQSIRYVLLSPKEDSSQNEFNYHIAYSSSGRISENSTAFSSMIPSVQHQTKDPQDCSYSDKLRKARILRGCRTNRDKSVIVRWNGKHVNVNTGREQGVEFSQQEADNLILVAESIIDRYYDAGFTNAKIESQWFGYALSIVVTRTGDPQYRLSDGVLELPVSAAKGYSADNPPVDLLHELAHWIQNKKYYFLRASISGSRRWWLETSAENMVFMVEPKNIDANLNIYRVMNGFQKAPFTWAMFGEQDEYVHAHLLWVSMCSNLGVCPLDQEQFKQAINTGIYPFADASRQNLLVNNLDDYALYLLNHPPRTSNLIAATGVKMGIDGTSRVGELVNVGAGGDVNIKFTGHGSEDRFIHGNEGPANTPSMKIDAQIEKGGVYPFTITGSDFSKSSLPVALIIEPGPPFWLKVGDAEPIRYDGSQQYTIQPISKSLGEEVVRIIALGAGDSNRFQAQVALIDLQGDWMSTEAKPLSLTHNCDYELIGERMVYYLVDKLSYHFAARGSYVYRQDGTGLSLVFEPEEGHKLSEVIYIPVPPDPEDPDDVEERYPYNTTYSGKISLTPDSIEWTMDMSMVAIKDEDGSHFIPEDQRLSGFHGWPAILILSLILIGLPGGLWLASKDNLSRRRILLLIIILNLVSLACITELIFNSNVKLDKIEYTWPIDVPLEVDNEPIFRLSGGQIVTKLSLTYEDISDLEFDSDTWELEGETKPKTCTIEVVTEDAVRVFHNGYWRDFNMFEEMPSPYD